MAEELVLPCLWPANVNVIHVDYYGKIELVPTGDVADPSTIPRYVQLPIPNDEAYLLACEHLSRHKFLWRRKRGELMDYNMFCTSFGLNFMHVLYKAIDLTLKDPIKITEQKHYMGAGRVSHIQDPDQVYVHLQPAYVDTISYMIHLGFKARKLSERLKTVEDIKIGEIYIFSDGRKNYRVQLLQRNVIEEQVGVPNVSGCVVCDEIKSKEKGSGSEYSSDEDLIVMAPKMFDDDSTSGCKNPEEKVKVSRIDYGGPPITIRRADLYDVDHIWLRPNNLPSLKTIPPLAFPVNVKYVQGSQENINDRVEELRAQQRIIKIETVWRWEGTAFNDVELWWDDPLFKK